jgi:signal transduction histidine kinase
MEGLIRDLLDYARLQGGRGFPLVRRDVDLRELCSQIVDELGVANASRTIVLEPGGEARGSCDPDRMMQLLGNLVSNALKHGARSGPVRVRCRSCGAGLAMEVENEGPAIPDAVLARMFEPFVQGAGADRGGIGLGLFIAREIARAHGGDIEARSTAEATVFTVRIPRHA